MHGYPRAIHTHTPPGNGTQWDPAGASSNPGWGHRHNVVSFLHPQLTLAVPQTPSGETTQVKSQICSGPFAVGTAVSPRSGPPASPLCPIPDGDTWYYPQEARFQAQGSRKCSHMYRGGWSDAINELVSTPFSASGHPGNPPPPIPYLHVNLPL